MELIKTKLKGYGLTDSTIKTYLFEYSMIKLNLNKSREGIKRLNQEKIVSRYYKRNGYFVVKSANRQFQFPILNFKKTNEHKKLINNYLIKNFNLELNELETKGILDFIAYKFNEKGKIIDLFLIEVKAEGQGVNINQINWILKNKNIPIKIIIVGKYNGIIS